MKFTFLSKYDPYFVSNSRDKMSRFVTNVFDLVKDECHTSMLHDHMNSFKLMVYTKSIEKSNIKWRDRYVKREIVTTREHP